MAEYKNWYETLVLSKDSRIWPEFGGVDYWRILTILREVEDYAVIMCAGVFLPPPPSAVCLYWLRKKFGSARSRNVFLV